MTDQQQPAPAVESAEEFLRVLDRCSAAQELEATRDWERRIRADERAPLEARNAELESERDRAVRSLREMRTAFHALIDHHKTAHHDGREPTDEAIAHGYFRGTATLAHLYDIPTLRKVRDERDAALARAQRAEERADKLWGVLKELTHCDNPPLTDAERAYAQELLTAYGSADRPSVDPVQAREDAELERAREPVKDRIACQWCGRRDGLDAVLPDVDWEAVSRIAGDARILCLWCIDALAERAGIPRNRRAILHFAGRWITATSDSEYAGEAGS